MPYDPPPELSGLSLAQIAQQVEARALPPVETWSPQRVNDSEMRIAADGTWYHQGSKITRPAMVRAFSGLLTRDDEGDHWLVTPFEKLSIEVEDAAFVAVDCVLRDGNLAFRLNTDELVIAGPDHPIRARGDAETPAIYVEVRRGCEARLNRSTYQQLVAIAIEGADADEPSELSVTSTGETFSLVP